MQTQAVYRPGTLDRPRDFAGRSQDSLVHILPRRGREELRVGQSPENGERGDGVVQHHSRSYQWTGERTATGLVRACEAEISVLKADCLVGQKSPVEPERVTKPPLSPHSTAAVVSLLRTCLGWL